MNDWHLIRSVARWNGDAFQWWPEVTIARGSYEAMQAAGRLCGYAGPQMDDTGLGRGFGDWWKVSHIGAVERVIGTNNTRVPFGGATAHYRIEQRPSRYQYVTEAERRETALREWLASFEDSGRCDYCDLRGHSGSECPQSNWMRSELR